jgi:hypothetical protein
MARATMNGNAQIALLIEFSRFVQTHKNRSTSVPARIAAHLELEHRDDLKWVVLPDGQVVVSRESRPDREDSSPSRRR